MQQPKIIKSSTTKVYVKNGPSIELSEEEAEFCRKVNFWPGKMEITITDNNDLKMAEKIAEKCECKLILKQ